MENYDYWRTMSDIDYKDFNSPNYDDTEEDYINACEVLNGYKTSE